MNSGLGAQRSSLVGIVGASLLAAGIFSAACSSSSRDAFVAPPEEEPAPGFDSELDAGEPEDGGKCVSEAVTGQAVPLALVVLLDRSGSMSTDMWASATNAIRSFVDRSEVVGMQVGLQFFPPVAGDQCSPSVYANLSVPIGPLPDNVLPIQQRLTSTTPGGGTPMGAALEGGILAMRTWLAESAPHAGAVILVTDGDPAGCGGGIDAVAGIAALGAKPGGNEPSVRTFAVGMQGATFSNLNKVAAAGGGAPTAFNVGGGAAAQQALLDALETIRTSAIGCEYVLPTPPPDKGVLDLDSVELNFTPGDNDPTVNVRRVANKAACGATTGGFYYDDPKTPERIILCPASCELVRGAPAEAKPKLDVVLGCIRRPN
ncbi:MAG: VWA domain-containing protein [Labilithrix sp.]|nr:VWA domain-containing protein [Labilithrix sp.]